MVALGSLIAAPLWALIGWLRGRNAAQRAAAVEKERDYAATRRQMDTAETEARSLGNDPDAARRWLRERDAASP